MALKERSSSYSAREIVTVSVLLVSLGEESLWEKAEENILNTIDVLAFPKKLSPDEDKIHETCKNISFGTFISNIDSNHLSCTEKQYVIKMDVQGHILGVAWILLTGLAVSKEFKRIRNDISAALYMNARYLHNPGTIRDDLKEETDDILRELASKLAAFSSEYCGRTFCRVKMKDAKEACGK